MRSSLNQILCDQLVGKKIAEQGGIHDHFWGATITDVYASRDPYCEDHAIYVIRTNCSGNNLVILDPDSEITLE